ncbi:unnamed protein product [Kuraishia capsulata CBS 1993]|uniref:AAA+ ATPase domain-containing protein n=1 Tax=Kuraishia capsulata CBS 1993 TaxID=1382522 RepID=W6MM44_9ASCO|nr:uncharacterized protein KUCA_T00003236001 [Kuraishia capsulata CBS 1993]CDK27258.1 unnamed protein product [Kuraishia capsulata CBS 1993]
MPELREGESSAHTRPGPRRRRRRFQFPPAEHKPFQSVKTVSFQFSWDSQIMSILLRSSRRLPVPLLRISRTRALANVVSKPSVATGALKAGFWVVHVGVPASSMRHFSSNSYLLEESKGEEDNKEPSVQELTQARALKKELEAVYNKRKNLQGFSHILDFEELTQKYDLNEKSRVLFTLKKVMEEEPSSLSEEDRVMLLSAFLQHVTLSSMVPRGAERNLSTFKEAFQKIWNFEKERQEAESGDSEGKASKPESNSSSSSSSTSNSNSKSSGPASGSTISPLGGDSSGIKILGTFAFLLGLMTFFVAASETRQITWEEFRTQLLDKGYVERLIVVNKNLVEVYLNDAGKSQSPFGGEVVYFTIGSLDRFERKLIKAQEEKSVQGEFRVPVQYEQRGGWVKVVMMVLPTLAMFGGLIWVSKKMSPNQLGGGLFSASKSKAKKFNVQKSVKVKFDDVAGCDEAKEEIMEFVKFLKNPKKYEKLGAKIPRGAILSGPPGTGKTLLARATAGEAGVPFYSVSGSEFVEIFGGVGASRVRDLFKDARASAPSIVFVDEIDAIGKARGQGKMAGSNDERENTLNQLLVEMDGFGSNEHVVVLAGTNRADVLDPALLRPGRFDRKIYIDNPELSGRQDIFAVHLKNVKVNPKINMEDLKGRLATMTPGFSGADIANCANEAALIAARTNSDYVEVEHFEQAIERVIAGLEKKSRVLSPEEKKTVAYHEAGHAICGWFLELADPLLKVSIVPRGSAALGYAQYLPADVYLYSVDKLMDRMTMTLGGRVSEELHFDSVTSGASDDFEKVTAIAQKMVIECGMSEKIGYLNYNQDRGNDMTKPYSDRTAKLIDSEIHRIVAECYERCKKLLTEKSKEVGLVAEELLAKEVITREDMIRLLGERPYPTRSDAFDKYLTDKKIREEEKHIHEEKKEEDEGEKPKDA